MIKKPLLSVSLLFIFSLSVISQEQEKTSDKKDMIIPYVGFLYGGCDISIPFSFLAGIQQVKSTHFSILYDVHYWNTNYECYCEDTYSKGHFSSITPSVKLVYNTGKKPGNGFFAGVGLGYMIAKDRGTEQTYHNDPLTNEMTVGKEEVTGRWDFNSIAPSLTFGVGFRLFKLPLAISNSYYFANTTEGWGAVAGGVGLKIGLRRIKD